MNKMQLNVLILIIITLPNEERKPFRSKKEEKDKGKYFIEHSLLSDNDDIIGGKIKSAKHESTQGENLVKGMLSLNFQVNLLIDPYLVRELTTYLRSYVFASF